MLAKTRIEKLGESIIATIVKELKQLDELIDLNEKKRFDDGRYSWNLLQG